jgi:16S rRNA (guanine527-N7)-methyltransferase
MNIHSLPTQELSLGLLALGLPAEHHNLERLMAYLALLQKWNKTYNITAITEPGLMMTHHLLDSLSIISPLLQSCPDVESVLDVGSGAGLPGVVLAVMCPHLTVTCVDAVGKKVAFVNQVALTLRLPNLKAVHSRVESMSGTFDLITSRAFSSLEDFVRCSKALSHGKTKWLAMKAQVSDDELKSAAALANVFHVEPLTVPGLDAKRCIVWMQAL